MTNQSGPLEFIVTGRENGEALEFNAGSLETAERLAAELAEQGVTEIQISKSN